MRIPDGMLAPKLDIETTKAKLLMKTTKTSFDIDVQKNGLQIENHPLKLDIDNRAFFDSLGLKSIDAFAKEYIEAGKQAALKATGRYSKEAEILSDGGTICDLAYIRTQKSIESMLFFIPEEKPQLSWEDGYTDIKYEPDEFRYNWDTGSVDIQYIPFSVKISVED